MKIEEYSFGEIVVNGKKYTSDLIILPNKVVENWWRKEGHKLHIEDLKEVLEKEEIKTLIVGTGYSGYMEILPETRNYLEKKGVKVVSAKTGEAVKFFNKLSKKGKTAAALHLTC